MNRIYQGRVSKVEILNGKNADGQPLDINVLWRHHELFQDAVNYYLVCLLSLATDPQSEIGKLREQITKDGGDASVWTSFLAGNGMAATDERRATLPAEFNN